jgi:TRAP-type C4-dicarboxylate transport system permease small subunit
MAKADPGVLTVTELEEANRNYRRRRVLCTSLFVVFFLFYIASAIVQTPALADLAGIPVLGLPLGLLMSLLIFPVSWAVIVVFFVSWR